MQPVLQHCRVDRAEIDRKFQVASVQIRERWMLSNQPWLQTAADQEHRRGSAVVGAVAGVLLDAAAKFTECHYQYPLVVFLAGQILPERAQSGSQLLQQLLMSAFL